MIYYGTTGNGVLKTSVLLKNRPNQMFGKIKGASLTYKEKTNENYGTKTK